MARAKKSTAKKKTAKPKAKAKKSQEVLLVGSKVRAEIKGKGLNTAGDAIEGLNDYVHWLLQQATERAQANNRKTVRKHDFIVQ